MTKLTEIINDLRAGEDIKEIFLYRERIGNEEVKLLIQALEKYTNTVIEIDLSHNHISKEGAGLIACFLEKNSSVMHIDLRWNKIDNDGARLILQALRKNNTVTEMDLFGNKSLYANGIDYSLIASIDKILEKNILRAKKALSKKSDQGIDSVQEKLPVTDTNQEKSKNISKEVQQLKKVGQEQKSEQQEEMNTTLAQIINKQTMQDDILKLIVQKLDVVTGEIKQLKEQSSGQQKIENSSGTESIGEHLELLLGVVDQAD
ncbi:hypothetical protein [Candidatus Tisiphia endosymbiont of Hybos culiciformis]|uniref:hypothetical protein n=1 Tax=Candidatus Tisiphia endosymbiont of Hybos culiciformis TaxID=3139331 RepID=UPI003CCAEA03